MSAPPSNRGRHFAPEPLTPAEVIQLIGSASNRSASGIRLRAIVGVLYGSGVRLAEALALEPRDVDTQAGTIRVREGKGRKTRLVGIDPRGSALLDRWLDKRKTLGLNARHPIFATYEVGKVGKQLDPRYVRLALARLGRKAGITKRVHPHGLRHSLAFDMAQSGIPTHKIKDQLGHESLAVTDRYVNHLMPADVVEVMRNRSW
jgi:integrase/recombinase XerD